MAAAMNTRGNVRDILHEALGDEITDPEEDTFLVFSQPIPSQNLGFVDSKSETLEINIAGRDVTIHQSPGVLSSNREGGTTGAVVWKVTPLFAQWLASSTNFIYEKFLDNTATVIELGTGVSGIAALAFAPKVGRYIATDQDYVLKLLRRNIDENQPPSKEAPRKKKSQKPAPTQHNSVELFALDWETSEVSALPQVLGLGSFEMLIACDCIYNESLIEPFVSTCASICALAPAAAKPTLCVIAQQLRSSDVFELWLTAFHQRFHVWRVPDLFLTPELKDGSGFVVHVGVLR